MQESVRCLSKVADRFTAYHKRLAVQYVLNAEHAEQDAKKSSMSLQCTTSCVVHDELRTYLCAFNNARRGMQSCTPKLVRSAE